MNPFEFYNPVKLIYGPGEVKRAGQRRCATAAAR